MKKSYKTVNQEVLRETLEPNLLNRVFHVTSHKVANLILRGENLKPNIDGSLESGFGSSQNSFFRKRGCISFFDFRNVNEEYLNRAYSDANALNPNKAAKYNPAFLFLNSSYFNKLISWTAWKEEKAFDQMIVPYVECGYKGEVMINLIEEIIFVEVVPKPKSLLLKEIE